MTISRDGRFAAVRLLEHVPGHGDGRAAGPQHEGLGPGALPMAFGQERLQGQPAGDRVLGVADEAAAVLRDAADLAHQVGVVVEPVELVAAGVSRSSLCVVTRAPSESGSCLDEGDGPAVVLRLVVPAEVHSPDRPRRPAPGTRPSAGKTFMIDDWCVVTPMKYMRRPVGGGIGPFGRQRRPDDGVGHGTAPDSGLRSNARCVQEPPVAVQPCAVMGGQRRSGSDTGSRS